MKRNYLFLAIAGLWIVGLIHSCKEDGPTDPDPVYTYDPHPVTIEVPTNYPEPAIPEDNPCTEEGIYLGRLLFYDTMLSKDYTMSCASCHLQANGFTDAKAVSTGIDGIAGTRSSMPLFNLAYMFDGMFWDGRSADLEAQILQPVPNPIELHLEWTEAISRIQASTLYEEKFYNAFGDLPITKELTAKAIAQFLRTIVSFQSKFDLATRPGSGVFFTVQELVGYNLFNQQKGQAGDPECFHCHGGRLFTDNKFHNNGLDNVSDISQFPDKGRGAITANNNDMGKFKTPSLRNLAYTAPYMHDGRFATLEEVIDHYSSGIHNSPTLDPIIGSPFSGVGPVNLSPTQKAAMIAFLHTLNDSIFIQNPAFSDPN